MSTRKYMPCAKCGHDDLKTWSTFPRVALCNKCGSFGEAVAKAAFAGEFEWRDEAASDHRPLTECQCDSKTLFWQGCQCGGGARENAAAKTASMPTPTA